MNMPILIKRIAGFALAVSTLLGNVWGQDDIREKAAAAIRSGDHEAAVRLCQEGLRKNPVDYDLNFLLARALAFSGQWDEALRVLDGLSLAHPENTDLLVFRARVKSWKHDFQAAEAGYAEVLRLNPGNSEAQTGLAEIASWKGDYSTALALYRQVLEKEPLNPDIHFRLGRVHLWQGSFARAEENFQSALRLDPQNKEYKRALLKARPRLQEKFELRYELQSDNFDDGRARYLDQNLALQLNLFKKTGPFVLKFNHTERSGLKDSRYGLEFYPTLWKRAYGYVDIAYSPSYECYPRTAYLFEAYQSVRGSVEVSFGFRRMNFAQEGVSQYLGSLGYYFGRYLAYWRWYYAPGEPIAWLANIRRYFSTDSFLFIGFGQGLRTEDVVTWNDYRADQSWVFQAGFNWYVLRKIRLQAYFSSGDEGAVRRNTLFIGTGYRW